MTSNSTNGTLKIDDGPMKAELLVIYALIKDKFYSLAFFVFFAKNEEFYW